MKERDTRYKSRHVLADEEYHNMLYRGITIEEYLHQAQEARLKEIEEFDSPAGQKEIT